MCDFALKAQIGVVLGPWVKGGGAMDREKRAALRGQVEEGYRRLAFGPVGDAVRLLLLEEGEALDWGRLDLFNVSEIRRVKGGMEMKFFSRLEALDRLAAMAGEEAGEEDGFYAALDRSARALYRREGEGGQDPTGEEAPHG